MLTSAKRAIQLIPLLAGLGVAAGVGTATARLSTSLSYYQNMYKGLSDSLDDISKSTVTLQNQFDSLVGVVLQNHRGLDRLTAERGGLCLFLEEGCCFYVNQSSLVRDAAKKLSDRVSRIRQ